MVHNQGGWARRRAQRSQEIQEAALGLLVETGLDGFTLQKLAERMGAAVGAVYRYFPSKEALLVAIQRTILETLTEALVSLDATVIEAMEGRAPRVLALSRLLAAARHYRTLPEREPARFRLLAYAVGDPRELVPAESASEVVAAALPLFAFIGGLLEAAVQAEALDPGVAAERAVILWASLHGVVQLRKLARVQPLLLDTDRLAPKLLHDLLRGWGADPRTLAAAEHALEEDLDAERKSKRALRRSR